MSPKTMIQKDLCLRGKIATVFPPRKPGSEDFMVREELLVMTQDFKDFDLFSAEYPDLARRLLGVLTNDLEHHASGHRSHDTHSIINQVWEHYVKQLGPIIRVHEKNRELGNPEGDRRYLLKVAINKIRSILGKVERRTEELPDEVEGDRAEDVDAFQSEMLERLQVVFPRLPKNYQTILVLNGMKGVPYVELIPLMPELGLKRASDDPKEVLVARLTDLKRRAIEELRRLLSRPPASASLA